MIIQKLIMRRQLRKLILPLGLLDNTDYPRNNQIRRLYSISNNTMDCYKRRTIQKSDGTARELLEPNSTLKEIQRNILQKVLNKLPISPYATAYRKGVNILCNVSKHIEQKTVLKMDIRDFFGNIGYYEIYSVFLRSNHPESVAGLLAHLCCYGYTLLPQGAPTSPAISNLVMKPFDDYIGKWCEQREITYTRYCDDMTFSGDFDANQVIRKVRNFLYAMGFKINERKTQIMNAAGRQIVTGIVVNEKPQVSRAYRDKLRQEIYYCEKYGVTSHLLKMNNLRFLPIGYEQKERYLQSLLGRINYILQINPQDKFFMKSKETISAML